MKLDSGIRSAKRTALAPPPLPILSPTALTADGGDGRVYLRWNPQLEDSRIVGWKVRRIENGQTVETIDAPDEPALIVTKLTNGKQYTFEAIGVLKDGSVTPPSNSVDVMPRQTGDAKVETLDEGAKIVIGDRPPLIAAKTTVRVTFPDGQQLIYDQMRPVDWKTADGEHLIYPGVFGNGLDIGQFDERGLPEVIPPEGMKLGHLATVNQAHNPAPPVPSEDYRDAQFGVMHPYITDPMTLPIGRAGGDARASWFEPQVDGNRVTFRYWQPLKAMGYKAHTMVLVWETWWPIERDRHGTMYHGLARLVEVQMPSALNAGYQVMLNNGFGPGGGSRNGVICYSTGFRDPASEVIDFSGDKNQQICFQDPKPPRRGYGYHPNHDCLQSSPLIFYDWGKGSLTISARSLYYHCANNTSSYPEEGADGVWPNLAWDMAIAGERTAMDTVEYLYTSDMRQALPQRYVNARFDTYSDVSRRMGLQDELGAVAMIAPHSEVKAAGGFDAFAKKYTKEVDGKGIDVIALYHDAWNAMPIECDDAYRFDETFDCNPGFKRLNAELHEAGLHSGFWYRPEFTKTSLVNALSDKIPTAELYYGYSMCKYPDLVPLLHERGIPLFRQNTGWVRKRRDGSYPFGTPYEWVPMSLATDWWERVAWPTLWMSARLGWDRVLVDGGFGGMQGVDYAPMLNGQATGAVAVQPYWWRMWRSMNSVGIKAFGECTVGWKGNNVSAGSGGPIDQNYLWMFQMGWYCGGWKTPQLMHASYQLYNSERGDPDSADAVRRFARKFYAQYRAPDWIEFQDLKQGGDVAVTVKVNESPVAGNDNRRVTQDETMTVHIKPWAWKNVIWHYNDGTAVVYPSYDNIDWSKQ